ncbi:helix-turn-helix transcriptional regulator [Lapidilactobacillus wuchangensis]|uniref:helix-turn-helix transcriptional regulator n=1 Tax=Lapidilactobacillus wuchangensis TaxID=2486001 RepID=UPI000F794DBC|nr:helix-turn-helix transcriptional regulator [Lapidilactobacillus wuchangensis]
MSEFSLANNLKNARQLQHLTQQQVADTLYVSRQTVSTWETGRNLPDPLMMRSLAQLYQVSTDSLLDLVSEKPGKVVGRKSAFLLGPVLAMLIIGRLTVATSAMMLICSDLLIVILLGLLWQHQRQPQLSSWLLKLDSCVSLLMILLATSNILKIPFSLQVIYLLSGLGIAATVGYHYWQKLIAS